MFNRRILVAFSSRTGSTAGAAALIANELRAAGLAVDLRPAAEVDDVEVYDAIVLGSGVFVPSRRSDGSGFLARFAAKIAPRPVWLFCVGPIGREPVAGMADAGSTERECGAVAVARSINARGVAAFGTPGLSPDADAVARLLPVDPADVRVWARSIVTDLGTVAPAPDPALRSSGARRRRRRTARVPRPGYAAAG